MLSGLSINDFFNKWLKLQHFNHFNQIFLCNDTEVDKDLRSVSLIKTLASGYSCVGS